MMEVIDKHIVIAHNITSARPSLRNVAQCNRSADTAKPTTENHESSTSTVDTNSLYKINGNIEHCNTRRFVIPNGDHTSRKIVPNHISNTEDFNED